MPPFPPPVLSGNLAEVKKGQHKKGEKKLIWRDQMGGFGGG